ncbi:uncharacterized protein LOC129284652 [Prosopis cineraria]|uniref:uncharacterized protein LOC129284652 n=1 Tax=Prosopis cineraria TaxID=364024 RepID=UPI0024102B7C|nr:uncharacterized protein LOC129284652 [Prosopis cineraria]
MACLDMYNNSENNGHPCTPMSPRISFSSDFVDVQQALKQERLSRDAPASSDFEFSVTNYSMMSADELFCKGRMLPFKDDRNNQMQRTTTTLREELLHDDEYEDSSQRPPKGSSSRRKGFMGLRKSHFGSKKADKSEGSSDIGVEGRRSRLVNESGRVNMTSQQDLLNDGSSSS